MLKKWKTFYPEYAKAHSHPLNKALHFIGATALTAGIITSLLLKAWWPLLPAIAIAYLLPGFGHRHFEGNESFALTKPVFCIAGAVLLYFDMWGSLFRKKR